ncbi:MAG: hypothetical protein KDA71_18800 [Planctomycetales bacterium]|nr:hypothetical protein [Planctomycetales bacterium]
MGIFDSLRGTPSKDRFAKMLMQALRDAGDTRQIEYDAEEFRLLLSDDGDDAGFINLANFYAQFCQVPKEHRAACLSGIVRGCLSHLKGLPDEYEDARPDLRPRLWARAMLEQMRLQSLITDRDAPDLAYEFLGQHLAITLVYDLPESVRSLSREDLDAWQVTPYEAMEVARTNLAEDEFMIGKLGDSLYASATGDSYDATRVILLDVIRQFEVKGEPIAMLPNRDYLLVTGSEDVDGMTMMLDLAEKVLQEEPRPLSPLPIRLSGDEWLDWMPPHEHPCYARLRLMEDRYLYEEYGTQKGLLDKIHETHGEDIFVASVMALEKQGDMFTCAVWPADVLALLPRTRLVALMQGPDSPPLMVAWEDLEAVVGDLLLPTNHYPPRFRVEQFPSESQLETLRRRAIET